MKSVIRLGLNVSQEKYKLASGKILRYKKKQHTTNVK
jgi:hypothetical protein